MDLSFLTLNFYYNTSSCTALHYIVQYECTKMTTPQPENVSLDSYTCKFESAVVRLFPTPTDTKKKCEHCTDASSSSCKEIRHCITSRWRDSGVSAQLCFAPYANTYRHCGKYLPKNKQENDLTNFVLVLEGNRQFGGKHYPKQKVA